MANYGTRPLGMPGTSSSAESKSTIPAHDMASQLSDWMHETDLEAASTADLEHNPDYAELLRKEHDKVAAEAAEGKVIPSAKKITSMLEAVDPDLADADVAEDYSAPSSVEPEEDDDTNPPQGSSDPSSYDEPSSPEEPNNADGRSVEDAEEEYEEEYEEDSESFQNLTGVPPIGIVPEPADSEDSSEYEDSAVKDSAATEGMDEDAPVLTEYFYPECFLRDGRGIWHLDRELLLPVFTMSENPMSLYTWLTDLINFLKNTPETHVFKLRSKIPVNSVYLTQSLLFCVLETILERGLANRSGGRIELLSLIAENTGLLTQTSPSVKWGGRPESLNCFMEGIVWVASNLILNLIDKRYESDSYLSGTEVIQDDRDLLIQTETEAAVETAISSIISGEYIGKSIQNTEVDPEDVIDGGSIIDFTKSDGLRSLFLQNLWEIIPSEAAGERNLWPVEDEGISTAVEEDVAAMALSAALISIESALLGSSKFTPGMLTMFMTGFCDQCSRCTLMPTEIHAFDPDNYASVFPMYSEDIVYPLFSAMHICSGPVHTQYVPSQGHR